MKRSISLLVSSLALLTTACTAAVGTSGAVSVPADARKTCEMHCQKIGMGLGAVAIMANNVGCICDLGGHTAQTNASAVSAGMATVFVQEIVKQQQQQQALARK